MRVIQFIEYGDPGVLQLAEAPDPAPNESEVRVRVRAAAVNPADTKWRQGMFASFAPVSFPHIVGYDIAGIVDSVGSGVTCFAEGDRVVAMLDGQTKGGYAEYALVPAAHLVPIPDNVSFATAAAVPTAGLTGVQIVEKHARVKAGDVLLVTGAMGAVGRFALHALRLLGGHAVAAVRSSQIEDARRLGSQDTIVLGETEWNGPAFDAVIDTVGGLKVAQFCRHVRADGKIFTVATTPIDAAGLPSVPVFVTVQNDPARLAALIAAVAAGEIDVPIARLMPLDQAAAAHRLLEAGGISGKIVLEP